QTLVHVTGSTADAQDVAQNALVQAFVKLDTFRGTSSFYTWLYRIALNQAISLKRREKRTESVDLAKELSGCEPIDNDCEPQEHMLRQERVAQVRAALDALDPEHRSILVLREMEGCCYETIAGILELPIGTVRSRLHRARFRLREQLKEVLQKELG
ncbi:unnamed protein product, partial [marine sediment metagenome]